MAEHLLLVRDAASTHERALHVHLLRHGGELVDEGLPRDDQLAQLTQRPCQLQALVLADRARPAVGHLRGELLPVPLEVVNGGARTVQREQDVAVVGLHLRQHGLLVAQLRAVLAVELLRRCTAQYNQRQRGVDTISQLDGRGGSQCTATTHHLYFSPHRLRHCESASSSSASMPSAWFR